MFCYNCGTKLPDGAKFCMSCGTKLDFGHDSSGNNKSGNTKTDRDLVPAKTAVPAKKDGGKKYKIGNYTILFGENEFRYIKCNQLLNQSRLRIEVGCYAVIKNEVKSFDDIGNVFIPKLMEYINQMIEVGVETLMNNSIDYFDHNTLMNELLSRRSLKKGLNDFFEAGNKIELYEEQLDTEYANRSRFEGGGFGITGAIKGTVKAEMMNLGMDALRGIGKWVTGNTDSDKMRRFKATLFEELHGNNFEINAFNYFCNAVEPLVNDILVNEGVMRRANFNVSKASAKLQNLKKAASQNRYTNEQLSKSLLEGLLMNPYNIDYYESILYSVPNSKQGLKQLADDCGIGLILIPITSRFDYDQKLNRVKKYTSDPQILNKLDDVAINQQDLDEILDSYGEGLLTIYLTEGVYVIPLDRPDTTFVGLGKVTAKINSDVFVDFEEDDIFFQNIVFDDDYKEILRLKKLVDDGIINLRAKEYEKAEQLFSEARENGSGSASWFLGLMFRYGLGVPKNTKKAESLFAEGDKRPDKNSAAIIADICKSGELFPADYKAALQWYEKSEPNSTHLIAMAEFYEHGLGVPKDLDKAVQLYGKAADEGDDEAYYRYAMLSDISLKEKFAIFNEVANNGHPEAMYQIGVLHAEHYDEVFDENSEVSATNAFSYFRKAAEKGSKNAMYSMGLAYLDGIGVEHSERLAVDCLRKAVDKGHIEAMVELGVCYANGTGIKQNYSHAIELYTRAATLGNDEAEFNLGLCYQYGLGVPVDNRIAAAWYKKSCDKGNEDAKIALSELGLQEGGE